jgi:hypothetical protein
MGAVAAAVVIGLFVLLAALAPLGVDSRRHRDSNDRFFWPRG